jgi:hypothetical protein
MPDRNRRLILTARPTGMVDETTVRHQEDDAPEPSISGLSRPRRLCRRDGVCGSTQARSTHILT